MKQYPDSLTETQLSRFLSGTPHAFFSDSNYKDTNACIKARIKLQLKMGGAQVYTRVDCDGKLLWSKGPRVVNRTGQYVIMRKKGFEIDNS